MFFNKIKMYNMHFHFKYVVSAFTCIIFCTKYSTAYVSTGFFIEWNMYSIRFHLYNFMLNKANTFSLILYPGIYSIHLSPEQGNDVQHALSSKYKKPTLSPFSFHVDCGVKETH